MTGGILHAGDIIIDQAGIVVTIGGKPISLKTMEYKLLSFMLKNKNKVLTKSELFENTWGDIVSESTLNVHIRRLREKIESDTNNPNTSKPSGAPGTFSS